MATVCTKMVHKIHHKPLKYNKTELSSCKSDVFCVSNCLIVQKVLGDITDVASRKVSLLVS